MFLLHSTNIHPQTFATKRVPSFLMGDFGIVPNSLFYSTGENYAVENCFLFFVFFAQANMDLALAGKKP